MLKNAYSLSPRIKTLWKLAALVDYVTYFESVSRSWNLFEILAYGERWIILVEFLTIFFLPDF